MFGIIIPLIFIAIAIFVIGFLIYRNYPQLTLIDIDTIPEVKEAKKKYELVKNRLEKRSEKKQGAREVQLLPLKQQWKKWQRKFRNYVNNIANELREQNEGKELKKIEELSTEEKQLQAKEKIRDARRAQEQFEYEFAEKCYIEAVRIDPRSADAYRGLADVYIKQEQGEEAKETLYFLHKLQPEDDSVLLKLAELSEEMGDIKSAVDYYEQAIILNPNHAIRFAKLAELLMKLEEYETAFESLKQAVELEPQNPKYLDNLVETAILVEQLDVANETFIQLRTVNPDNQKIDILKDKLRLLSEKLTDNEKTA